MVRLVRIATVPVSLDKLLEGQMGYFRGRGMDVVMVSADGPQVQKVVAREGCPHRAVPMTRSVTPLKDLASLVVMARLLRALRPQIVHTHTPKAGLIGMLAARLSGVPIRLHTVAGLPLMEKKGFQRRLLVLMEGLTYLCATAVYANSTGLMGYIKDHRFAGARRVSVLGYGSSNGIDTGRFARSEESVEAGRRLRRELGIPTEGLVFAFVGRIVRDKGIVELCAAFRRLSLEHGDVHLVLAGGSEDDLDPIGTDAQREIRDNSRIHSLGFVDDVRPTLAASDVLVFPSYREGFPNVPMQAGCMDLPSIVTDINGCNEIIVDGVNGLIVPVKDEGALYVAMDRFLRDKSLRERCGGAARSLIVEKYRREFVWGELEKQYDYFLRQKGIYG